MIMCHAQPQQQIPRSNLLKYIQAWLRLQVAILNAEEHTLDMLVDISNQLKLLALSVILHTMFERDRVRSALFLSRSDENPERGKEYSEGRTHHLYL